MMGKVDEMSELSEVLGAHWPGEDWHCGCGEDLFGGSAAYSRSLYNSHLAGVAIDWFHTDSTPKQDGRRDEFVRERFTQPNDERAEGDPVRQSYDPCARQHQPGRVCIQPDGHA